MLYSSTQQLGACTDPRKMKRLLLLVAIFALVVADDDNDATDGVEGRSRSKAQSGKKESRFFGGLGGFDPVGGLGGGFGLGGGLGGLGGGFGVDPSLAGGFGFNPALSGGFGVNPGFGGVNPAFTPVAPPSTCRYWCRTPEGQAYCCENINQPQSAAGVVKPGFCPPVRPVCPLRSFQPPFTCSNDGACGGIDKCCFDRCLGEHVCKAPLGIGR